MSPQIKVSMVSDKALLQVNTADRLKDFVRGELKAALAAPQHAASFAKAFAQLNERMLPIPGWSPASPPLTFRRAVLDEMQQRLTLAIEAVDSGEAPPDAVDELLALARLLPALLKEKVIAFRVVMGVLQDLLADREEPLPPTARVEAAVLMTIGLAPVIVASEYNGCYALEVFLEDRFKEVLQMAKPSSYHPHLMAMMRGVERLIEAEWDFDEPSKIIQCLPRADGQPAQFASLAGEVVHECCDEVDVATLRMILAAKFGLLEHEVGLISSKGELLRAHDLIE